MYHPFQFSLLNIHFSNPYFYNEDFYSECWVRTVIAQNLLEDRQLKLNITLSFSSPRDILEKFSLVFARLDTLSFAQDCMILLELLMRFDEVSISSFKS